MKNTVTAAIIAVTQSRGMRPALITLALSVAVLVVTGCDGSHDSGSHDPGSSDSDHHGKHGNHGNHGNQTHPTDRNN